MPPGSTAYKITENATNRCYFQTRNSSAAGTVLRAPLGTPPDPPSCINGELQASLGGWVGGLTTPPHTPSCINREPQGGVWKSLATVLTLVSEMPSYWSTITMTRNPRHNWYVTGSFYVLSAAVRREAVLSGHTGHRTQQQQQQQSKMLS